MARSVSGASSRIAVVCEGDPSDPTEWSGTPFGLMSGLRELGVEVVPLVGAPQGSAASLGRDAVALVSARPASLKPPALLDGLRRARRAAPYSALYGSIGSFQAARSLKHAGHVDAVVQIGTAYEIRHPRLVTFEDMTVRQAVHFDQYHWGDLREQQIEARVRRQARAYRRATAVLLATPWAARSVIDDYGIPGAKVAAVGLGRNRPAAAEDRDWNTPRFLFVGHDWVRKNGDAVVEAFTHIREQYPDATLDLVGGHPPIDVQGVRGHGPLRLGVPAEAAALGLLFAQATCLVMPSRFEAAGIVHVEAAACGVPSIGTLKGGAADLIGPGGMVVDPEDGAGIRHAMARMAMPHVAKEKGELARDRAPAFTWVEVAARVLHSMGLDGGRATAVPW